MGAENDDAAEKRKRGSTKTKTKSNRHRVEDHDIVAPLGGAPPRIRKSHNTNMEYDHNSVGVVDSVVLARGADNDDSVIFGVVDSVVLARGMMGHPP
eukprot:14205044-Ditylum_brightwellii.AAC.1